MENVTRYFQVALGISSIWAISPAVNPPYIPWGTNWIFDSLLVVSVAVLSLSLIVVFRAVREGFSRELFRTAALIIIACLVFVFSEVIYFTSAGDDHEVLGRQLVGLLASTFLLGGSSLLLVRLPKRSTIEMTSSAIMRFSFILAAMVALAEFILLFARGKFGSAVYQALDLSMFSVALVAATCLAALVSLARSFVRGG